MRDTLLPFGSADLTTDGDTGTQGVVIWLGTRSEERARRDAKLLIPYPEELDDMEQSRERERQNRRRVREDRIQRQKSFG